MHFIVKLRSANFQLNEYFIVGYCIVLCDANRGNVSDSGCVFMRHLVQYITFDVFVSYRAYVGDCGITGVDLTGCHGHSHCLSSCHCSTP